ncbi:hypothetical protein LWI28_000127 [Acer negundo]|uniref:Uncharacterized protein n=1 Tax=Acer negundo TaxID=4023 RepID=A0AAD5IBA0_ACENE|nr:hypothetical protein LWI28_000127 [Acer negundo]
MGREFWGQQRKMPSLTSVGPEDAHHEDHQNKAAEKDNDKINACIDVHQKALDDLVNVNCLFTLAVFVGLAYANPSQRSLENRPECDPDPGLGKKLVIFEVLLNIQKKELTRDQYRQDRLPELCKKILLSEPWKRISLGLSVVASFAGILLMTLSMVYVIQIRVGKLTCGSDHAIIAVAPLCVIVFAAMLFYVPSMAYAVVVTASACEDMKMDSNGSVTPKAPIDV